jgi:hypothetical protein
MPIDEDSYDSSELEEDNSKPTLEENLLESLPGQRQ